MITKLDDAIRFHEAALNLRAQRQEILATNIANADTPNFKARDIDFKKELAHALAGGRGFEGTLLKTSLRHFSAGPASGGALSDRSLLYRIPAQASVDGNTVEMDAERAQFAENALRYETSLTVIGLQIKNLLAAIQG